MSISTSPLDVHPIRAFADNYIWAIESPLDPNRIVAVDPGDAAPDFNLLKLDKSDRVQLSSLHQPVVLIFGSYT